MKITVKFHASLKKYAGGGENGVVALDIPPMNVAKLIDYLGINRLDVGIIVINGVRGGYLSDIHDDDQIQLFTELKGG